MLFYPHLIAGFDIQTLPQQVVNGLLMGSIYALIALGYTMVYGVLKLINFAHGEVFMLGAYGSLFTSWALGYGPNGHATHASYLALLLMMLASMTLCGLVGVIIERFAYRPLRNQARIASLITAIGLSLLLQYGGQVFLLNGVPQSISDDANPFNGKKIVLNLRAADSDLLTKAATLTPKVNETVAAFQAQLPNEKSQFDLSPKGDALQKEMQAAKREYDDAIDKANARRIAVEIPEGKLTMLVMTFVLMSILTFLVLFTKRGRAMRAVSLDFSASALMGINVDSIITFTFVLGSTLAGAGAMMYATLQSGTKIDPFLGMAPGLKAFVAAVLGGIGNIPGAVLGGILMGIAENLVDWAGYDSYRDAIAFVILIIVLLFKPGGLLGSAKVEKV